MAALEVGTYVQIKRRAVTSADMKSRLYMQHFAGIAGEIERIQTAEATCIVKADQDMLPIDIAKRHAEFYEGDTKGYGGMKGYPVLVALDDVEPTTVEEARNPVSVYPVVESWANKVGIPITELTRDIGAGNPEGEYKQLITGKTYRCVLKFDVLAVNTELLFNTAKKLRDNGITDAVFVACTVMDAKPGLYNYHYYLMVCDPEPVKKETPAVLPDEVPVVEVETAPEPLSGARRNCNDEAEIETQEPSASEDTEVSDTSNDEDDFDTFLAGLIEDDSSLVTPKNETEDKNADDNSDNEEFFFFVEE